MSLTTVSSFSDDGQSQQLEAKPAAAASLQPHTISFFGSSGPQLQVARASYFKRVFAGCILIAITIFAILSIYWGALWKTPVRPLQGWVIDFDGGEIGSAITQGLASPAAAYKQSYVTWSVLPASSFPNGPSNVVDKVLTDKTWVAITINANSSAKLGASIANPDPSYDPTTILSVYAMEARNENAFRLITMPTVQEELAVLVTQFALNLAATLPTLSPNLSNILTKSPQTLVQPIGYQIINLRPFDHPIASAVTFVGMIYLLVLSFFLVLMLKSAREISGLERLLTTRSLILLRLGTAFVGFFFLSLFYSLLTRAFQLPFDRFFGNAGFPIFWMVNYVGMLSLGLALESMITILTARFIPFFMILWIISNVSVCFFPLDVLPHIYRYGYAFPFYNANRAIRAIVFGTHNTIGMNFGILLAWVVVSCVTLPLFQVYISRRQLRAERAQLQETMVEPKRLSEESV